MPPPAITKKLGPVDQVGCRTEGAGSPGAPSKTGMCKKKNGLQECDRPIKDLDAASPNQRAIADDRRGSFLPSLVQPPVRRAHALGVATTFTGSPFALRAPAGCSSNALAPRCRIRSTLCRSGIERDSGLAKPCQPRQAPPA